MAVSDMAGLHPEVPVASYRDSGVLLASGKVYDWGLDSLGQLGDGIVGSVSPIPVEVQLPGSVAQIAQGGSIGTNGQTLVKLSGDPVRLGRLPLGPARRRRHHR